jgi:hypothetical protein
VPDDEIDRVVVELPPRPATDRGWAQKSDYVSRHRIGLNGVGGAVATQRGQEQVEHVGLALGVERLERDHETRRVVEHREYLAKQRAKDRGIVDDAA